MQTLLSLFLLITTYLLIKQYPYPAAKKKKLKYYLLLIFTTWLIALTLYLFHCSPGLTDVNGNRLELLFFVLFTLISTFFMIYIRMLFNNSYWYLLLLIPVTWGFFFNLLLFNEPTYNGAMDGFAAIMKFYAQQKIIIIYPLFVFAFSMTGCHSRIKAIGLFFFVILTGITGINQSIGHEGWLADDTGDIFIVMLLILTAISTHSFFPKAKNNINNQPPDATHISS